MGFAMVAMSLLALPVLMRLFTWTTGQVADSAAGGGFLQTALSGAVALGALRGSFGGSGGSGAAEQARLISAQLGPSGSGPSGAQAPGTGVRQPAAPPARAQRPGAGASGMPAARLPPAQAQARHRVPPQGPLVPLLAGPRAPGPPGHQPPRQAARPAWPWPGSRPARGTARRKATEAMQPPQGAGGGQ